MDWPILVDSLNLLGTSLVPITLFIDERGIIREVSPPLAEAPERVRQFLQQDFGEYDHETRTVESSTLDVDAAADADVEALRIDSATGTAVALRHLADALVMWGGEEDLDESIAIYGRALRADPGDGNTHFRAGVAYRRRSESSHRQADDFSTAVRHWEAALEIDPNNYIWRRRIQQYGPRLEKPYPFYDWVDVARQEIQGRGEDPVTLPVEPRGAEIAQPLETFMSTSEGEEPDPSGRILRDRGEFIDLEVTVVPARFAAGTSARVHLVFRPRSVAQAHWNNEVEDLAVWVVVPPQWEADSELLTVARPSQVVSQEERRIELELLAGDSVAPGPKTISAYALYYVCEDVHGACLYRRQDVEIELEVLPGGTSSR